MFDYPLKKRELFIFLGNKTDLYAFDNALNELMEESAIFKIGNFYSLFNNHTLAERRNTGNEKAIVMLKKAEKAAAIISAFPFVQGVAVSGSLSKKFAGEDADIDFFIITSANRLWIARTLLHVFKKATFIFNLQDLFCMNYFIDEAEPGILEKNIYTATEVATLLPLRGNKVFEKFYIVNSWTRNYLPNHYLHVSAAKEPKRIWISKMAEKIFDNRLGNLIDTRKKKKNSKGILMGMHTGKHFSKPNPEHFQKKLLLRYEKSLGEIFDQYELSLHTQNKSL
jgi:hypothetical protein